MCEKSCADCRFSLHDSGDSSVGIPDYWYCGIPELKRMSKAERKKLKGCRPIRKNMFEKLEAIDWDENKCPDICGQFSPRMIDMCGNCKATMDVPRYIWKLWVDSYEPIPICSEHCQKELQAQVDQLFFVKTE